MVDCLAPRRATYASVDERDDPADQHPQDSPWSRIPSDLDESCRTRPGTW